MTLRLRLVLALLALLTAGLAAFGLATTRLYERAQRDQLDRQVVGSLPAVRQVLAEGAAPPGGRERRPQRAPAVLAPGSYAELRAADGRTVLRRGSVAGSGDSTPALPDAIAVRPGGASVFGAPSAEGSGDWRVAAALAGGTVVVVAVPLTEVEDSVRQLVLIEVGGALLLLGVLGAGSWAILRRGLQPLERMASSARTIAGGDLSHRVEPADARSEVGQLGLALNTMLAGIEEAFRQREATERRLRQFLADASHELRTPLTSIRGFAELFRLRREGSPVDLEVVMRRIEEEGARMSTLVEDLLLLARIDQTRPVALAPVDLAVLAADACTDAKAADPARPVALEAPRPVVVLGDEGHLRQAIANLVGNALKHTPAGTPIEVAAHVEGATAVVVVRDFGPGLDEAALAHAFDRFWQADSARAGSGAGLGLAIVAGIAAEHGGRAAAENAPGGGAAFGLRVPLAPAAAPVPGRAEGGAVAPPPLPGPVPGGAGQS